jgi:hypothetical protein
MSIEATRAMGRFKPHTTEAATHVFTLKNKNKWSVPIIHSKKHVKIHQGQFKEIHRTVGCTSVE